MDCPPSPFRIRPKKYGRLLRPLTSVAEKALGLARLDAIYRGLEHGVGIDSFLEDSLHALGVHVDVPDDEFERIPETGAAMVVANHPFGGLDGMILTRILRKRRKDVRVLANRMLGRITEMRDVMIDVDPFGGEGSEKNNVRGMREAMRWLEKGGLLLVFPAGEVAHRTWRRKAVSDPTWQPHIARMVQRTGTTVVPMFLGGQNGRVFQYAGLVHPRLRTLLLPRQLLAKHPRLVPVRVGKPLTKGDLEKHRDAESLVEFLRLRTEILGRRVSSPLRDSRRLPDHSDPIAPPQPTEDLIREIDALPDDARLVVSGAQTVYLTTAEQTPQVLQEIGRLREEAFRAVGEGTGRERDLDRFDQSYRHLFVWHSKRQQIIGAYRVGMTTEVTEGGKNPEGLYTHTLFQFDDRFLAHVTPGIELGRSFVRSGDQRSYSALLLLWRGIGSIVAKNPECATLFGPVSISSEYDDASLHLILEHLRNNRFADSVADVIQPRNPVPPRAHVDLDLAPDILADLEQVSSLVQEIEPDKKGVPTLVREYLKLGGKMAGFNVDPDFGDAIDGLVVVDMRQTPIKFLTRYLGAEATQTAMAAWSLEGRELS